MTAIENAGDFIGPYKLLGLLGEGGFGSVWLAERRQPLTQRVALKIIKPGMDSKAVIARFEQERQALALMDHPNVARVFDAGATAHGRPYFVMEHVPGEPITDFADRHKLSMRQRLELFIPICEAVQHAHHKGLIHRDLKPGNLLVALVDGKPVPKVIDFGVAKAIAHTLTDRTIFTEQGQIIGTPEYMSPEQAEPGAGDVDTRADVYSLGVVLYELLVGLLPFDSRELRRQGYLEIQRVIREVDPPTPSRRLSTIGGESAAAIASRRRVEAPVLRRLLHRELEWVPMRAIRKERAARYRSPSDLADDIRRYLDGRALVAGPERLGYRLAKFLRRNRIVVATAAAFVLLVAGSAVAAWLQAIANLELARRESEAKAEAVGQALLADERAREATRQAYVASIAAADGALQGGDTATALQRLEAAPAALRGFEWSLLVATGDLAIAAHRIPSRWPLAIAFSADGNLVHVGSFMSPTISIVTHDGRVVRSVAEAVSSLRFVEADGRTLTAGFDAAAARVVELETGRVIVTIPGRHGGEIPMALRADGGLLAMQARGSSTVELSELPSGNNRGAVPALADALSLRADGTLLAIGGQDGRLESNREAQVRLWDLVASAELALLRGPPSSRFHRVEFAPDGLRLAALTAESLLVFEVASGRVLHAFTGPYGGLAHLCWHPDGNRIAVGAGDQTARVLDLVASREMAILRGHTDRVIALAFDATGRRLASASRDGTVRIWDTDHLVPAARFTASHPSGNASAILSGDGGHVVLLSPTWPELFDAWTGRKIAQLAGHHGGIQCIAVSPDGATVATGGQDFHVRLLDAASGAPGPWLRGHRQFVTGVAFGPDGSWLVSVGMDGEARVWDSQSGRCTAVLAHGQACTSVAVAADDGTIAVTTLNHELVLWDHEQPDAPRAKLQLRSALHATFDPKGRRLAVTGRDGLTLLDRLELREIERRPAQDLMGLAFSPDGSRLALGCTDGRIRIWDAGDWTELLALRAHSGSVALLQWSRTGDSLLSTGSEGTACLWETRSARERYTRRQALAAAAGAGAAAVAALRDRGIDWRGMGAAIRADSALPPAVRQAALNALPPTRIMALRALLPQARPVVETALRELLFAADAEQRIANDPGLDSAVKALALELVRNEGDDARGLNERAWEAVAAPDAAPERIRLGLAAAMRACVLQPDDANYLDTLGVAQFRAGQDGEALRTLAKAIELCRRQKADPPPSALACTAMILFRSGHIAEARTVLTELTAVVDRLRPIHAASGRSFLQEALTLIDGR